MLDLNLFVFQRDPLTCMNFSIRPFFTHANHPSNVYSLIAGFRERRNLERFRSNLVVLTGSSLMRKLLCSLGEHTPQFARPISFQPTTMMCFPLFVVTRAGSTAAETGEAGERRGEPGACTVQVRRRRNRGENSPSFLPIVSRPVFPRTIVPIRTARSHAGSNAASFHCSRRLFVRERERLTFSTGDVYERKCLLSFGETVARVTYDRCTRVVFR